MTTLDFDNKLTKNPFNYGNLYHYGIVEGSGVFYSKLDKEIPYILRANYNNRSCHRDEEIYFSTYLNQLNNRVITTSKIKEILDTSHFPIRINFPEHITYLMGKGFLAELTEYSPGNSKFNILFLACAERGEVRIEEVKFYISREVFGERHKRVQPAVKELMISHPGDVITTADLSKYVGHKIKYPAFQTINEKNDFHNNLKISILKSLSQKPLSPDVAAGNRIIA